MTNREHGLLAAVLFSGIGTVAFAISMAISVAKPGGDANSSALGLLAASTLFGLSLCALRRAIA